MSVLAILLETEGRAEAPDYRAAVRWLKSASNAGYAYAGLNLAYKYAEGRGVARSKRKSTAWLRSAAENGNRAACRNLGKLVYADLNNARQLGHVEQAAGLTAPAAEGHDVSMDVLNDAAYWFQRGGHDVSLTLADCRKTAVEGSRGCGNDGCVVLGLRHDFKLCARCETKRYCGPACQREDWPRHQAKCVK